MWNGIECNLAAAESGIIPLLEADESMSRFVADQ